MNTLFDDPPDTAPAPPAESEEAKKARGRAIAADTHASALAWLRAAIRLKWQELHRTGVRDYVTADDARILLEIGIGNGCLERPSNMNWMGSLFAGKEWEFTGHYIKSETPGSHRNELKCWRWVGE